jgi:hypothetical protein
LSFRAGRRLVLARLAEHVGSGEPRFKQNGADETGEAVHVLAARYSSSAAAVPGQLVFAALALTLTPAGCPEMADGLAETFFQRG